MLTPSGPASYRCANFPGLIPMLEGSGYCATYTRSQYEAARFHRDRSIIILYHNGTVLLEGADLDTPRRLFATLIEAAQPVQAQP